MKIKLLFIVLSILIAFTLSKDAFICSEDGKLKCESDQFTCCKSKYAASGFACFKSPEGVCCEDETNFCPKGSVCNMKTLKCDIAKNDFHFLSLLDETVPITDTSYSVVNIPDGKSADFILGFFQGFGILTNLPNEEHCIVKINEPSISNDVIEIVQITKNLYLNSNLLQEAQNLSTLGSQLYSKLSEAVGPCKEWLTELEESKNTIVNHTKTTDYFKRVAEHTIIYFGDVQSIWNKSTNYLNNKEYYNGGIAAGKLVRFILFWDL